MDLDRVFQLKGFYSVKHRSKQLELLDTGAFTQEEYEDCLRQLDKVGLWLGGDRATWNALEGLSPQTIVDVGCGGGFFTKKLADRFPQAVVVGLDISEQAINFAKREHKQKNLYFKNMLFQNDHPPVDVVVSTLCCHHMTNEEIVSFLQACYQVAKMKVVINDLHRSHIAALFYRLLAPPLFRNRLITHDGLVSIARSFRKQDWQHLLHLAGIHKGQIEWKFPFRYLVTI